MDECRLLPCVFLCIILTFKYHKLLGVKKLTTYVNYANYLCERYSSSDGYFSVRTEHWELLKKRLALCSLVPRPTSQLRMEYITAYASRVGGDVFHPQLRCGSGYETRHCAQRSG